MPRRQAPRNLRGYLVCHRARTRILGGFMRSTLTLLLILGADAALAHPGHLVDVAGHDHWVAGAAIGLAILTGIYGALKGKKDEPEEDDIAAEEEGAPA